MPRFFALLLLVFIGFTSILDRAYAADELTITDRGTRLEFPNLVTFSTNVDSTTDITKVVLEYGVEQRTCGEVFSMAYPVFKPDKAVTISWTWDMRQSGSLPPGATIWYRWRATDASGAEVVSPEQRFTWLDSTHSWRSVEKGLLTLHWYGGSREFATELVSSAHDSLVRLKEETGVSSERPINIYIYESFDDLRAAVLYEPSWMGGVAYPEYSLTQMGVPPDQLEWGKRVTAHELTHVLVLDRAFSCIGTIPTWLNEGIAVYGEGGPEPYSLDMLEGAIAEDNLLSVRSLSAGFSSDPATADLSYTQSYSIVQYLITTFGREKILAVFDKLALGEPIETVLQDIYGFGVDGLEDRWRKSVGARPRQGAESNEPTPVPTIVPTLVPVEPGPHLPVTPGATTTADSSDGSEAPTSLPEEETASVSATAIPTDEAPSGEEQTAAVPDESAPPSDMEALAAESEDVQPPAQSTAPRTFLGLSPLLLALVVGIPLGLGLSVAVLLLATRKRG